MGKEERGGKRERVGEGTGYGEDVRVGKERGRVGGNEQGRIRGRGRGKAKLCNVCSSSSLVCAHRQDTQK